MARDKVRNATLVSPTAAQDGRPVSVILQTEIVDPSFDALQAALDAHEARTDNPHVVTAAQVGAPDLATFNAHAARHAAAGADPLSVLSLAGFPGGTTNFLRADGSFAAPPSGGGGAGALAALSVQASDVSGSTAGNNAWSFTLPAGTLANNGDILTLRAWYRLAANANQKILYFFFGSQLAFDDTTVINGARIRAEARIYRTAAAAQRIIWEIHYHGGQSATPHITAGRVDGAVDLTAAVAMSLGIQSATTAGDIVCEAVELQKISAPS